MSSSDSSTFTLKFFLNLLIFVFIIVGFFYIGTGKVQGTSRTILLVVIFCSIFYLLYYSKLFDTSTDLITSITDADKHSTIVARNTKCIINRITG